VTLLLSKVVQLPVTNHPRGTW